MTARDEAVIDAMIAELKALHEAIPQILLALAMAKAQASREAAGA